MAQKGNKYKALVQNCKMDCVPFFKKAIEDLFSENETIEEFITCLKLKSKSYDRNTPRFTAFVIAS